MTFSFRWLIASFTLGVLCCLGAHWWMQPAPPAPLTPAEAGQLGAAGFDPAGEGPVADTTPSLPGTPAGTVTVTMPRRRGVTPGDRPPALARHPAAGTLTSGPGGLPSVPGSPLAEPVTPAPILPDDLSCSTTADFRAAGGHLFTTGHVHACLWEGDSDQVCRDADGSEADITSRFDRAALCGKPVRGRLLTLGLGVAIPAPEIVAGLAYYGPERRMGYYGSLRYSLDPAASDTVQPYGDGHYRTVTATAARLRVEAGVSWRFGQ